MATPRISERTAGWGAAAITMIAGLIMLGAGTGLASRLPFSMELWGLSTVQTVIIAGGFLIVVYIVASSESEVSVPFVLSGLAIFVAAWALLPNTIQAMIPVDAVMPSGWDALTFALLTGLSILAYYIVAERAGKGAKTASTTAKRVSNDVVNLIEEWSTVTVFIGATVFGSIAAALGVFGPLTGQLADQVAQAPVIAADVATVGLGYFALSGELGITARQFLLFAAVMLALAFGVKYGD